ncbi:hypothetical protein CJF31_00011160 [Rutstroemia sp. NJR-2017a BVV2]|nr:hypothetical protein CJF31_00011160 [Rutstroemia sp. NJR-2017a BVV2]
MKINVYIMDCPIPVPPEAGLEVGTPKAIPPHDGLEVNWEANKSGLYGAGIAGDVEAELGGKGKPSRRCQRETILGLRVAWFWAVIVVLVILLAGGLGGGIAGGMAKVKSSVDQGSSTDDDEVHNYSGYSDRQNILLPYVFKYGHRHTNQYFEYGHKLTLPRQFNWG